MYVDQIIIDKVKAVTDNVIGYLNAEDIPHRVKFTRNKSHSIIYLGPVKSPKSGDEVKGISFIEIWPHGVKISTNFHARNIKTNRRYKIKDDNTISKRIANSARKFIDLAIDRHEQRKEKQKKRDDFRKIVSDIADNVGLCKYDCYGSVDLALNQDNLDKCDYVCNLKRDLDTDFIKIINIIKLKSEQVEEILKLLIKFSKENN